MEQEKKLKYRIAVHFESDHFIEAGSPEEAIRFWQDEMKIYTPYEIREQEWIKSGFRLTLELKKHLTSREQENLRESVSIDNVNKKGEEIKSTNAYRAGEPKD